MYTSHKKRKKSSNSVESSEEPGIIIIIRHYADAIISWLQHALSIICFLFFKPVDIYSGASPFDIRIIINDSGAVQLVTFDVDCAIFKKKKKTLFIFRHVNAFVKYIVKRNSVDKRLRETFEINTSSIHLYSSKCDLDE